MAVMGSILIRQDHSFKKCIWKQIPPPPLPQIKRNGISILIGGQKIPKALKWQNGFIERVIING